MHFYNGRYVTRLLWKSNHNNFGNYLENAKRRLMSLANKFKNGEWLKENYGRIMNELLQDEIIEQCKSDNLDENMM